MTEADGLRLAGLMNDFGSLHFNAALVCAHADLAEVLHRVKARAADFDHGVIATRTR